MAHLITESLNQTADGYLFPAIGPIGQEYANSRQKRLLDVCLSATATPTAILAIGLLGACVYARDHHYPLVNAGTLAPNGKFYPVWKIRSMVPDAQNMEADVVENGTLADLKLNGHDSRITPIGKRLRASNLDELPQLIQTLRGQISLVGPRHFSRSDWTKVADNRHEDPYREFLETLKTKQGLKFGITGFYFIFGREKLGFQDRIALETKYWNWQNFRADLKLIYQTMKMLPHSKGK